MKKVLSTIVVTIAAMSFAAIVSAADVPPSEPAGAAPSAEMHKDEAKPMKKHKHHRHHRKHHHKHHHQKAAPAPVPTAPPAPPAGQ